MRVEVRCLEIDGGVIEVEAIDEGDHALHGNAPKMKKPHENPWGPRGRTARDDQQGP